MAMLHFRIHEVKCNDETGSGIEEWATDDIRLAVVTIDNESVVTRTNTMRVGDFDDKDVKRYDPPWSVARFDLTEGYPKGFAVIVVLYEEDSGRSINPFLDAMVERIREQLTVRNMRGFLAEASFIAGIIAAIYAVTNGLYQLWADDEIFPPAHAVIKLEGPVAEQHQEVQSFRAHDGNYELKYSWAIEL